MSYQYKIIVNNKSFYKEFEITDDIERIKLGTTSACEFRLNQDYFFEELELILDKEDTWRLTCPDQFYISRGDVRKLFYTDLHHGDLFSVHYSESDEFAFQMRFLIDFEAEVPQYDWYIDLNETPHIIVGDSGKADIELESEFGKSTSVIIEKTNQEVYITEKSSKLGVLVNGKRIEKTKKLENCDFISVADFFGYYKNDRLYFCHKNIRTNGVKKYVDSLTVGTTYPKFVRNTRIKVKQDETPIKILDPASVPTKPELNIVTSLMPAIAMFALVVILRGVLSTTGGTFVLFSICSMGLGVITSIVSIFDKKKKFKKDCEDRRTTYLEYIENKKKEIGRARVEELKCLKQMYYSTNQDIEHIKGFSSVLFDRTPEDSDFLDVYLGIGTRKASRIIDYKLQEKLEVGDDLCSIPSELAVAYRDIQEAPVVVELKEANAIGIVGDNENRYSLMKNILLDLISRQYYGDLSVYVLIDENTDKYNWIQLLPHIQTGFAPRKIICDVESKNNVFENLYKELINRSDGKVQRGFNVVFVMEEHNIKNHPISRFIKSASELNTVFLFFEPTVELLPLHCSNIIEIESETKACIYESRNKLEKTFFTYSSISDTEMKRLVEILAPVYCDEISLEGALRKSISLFELLGIYDVRDIDLAFNWKQSRIYESMAVPLGVNVKNNIVYLDLHEKYHGPHGLVAGTTGSGKSEILQTFILGAVTRFHPYEIGFVIIDFKGGGMVNQFRKLPHLIGAITNIDGKAIERSLKSIKAELLKRQALFAEAEVNHIDKYIRAYKEGKVKNPLPHLVIIVDEFAELKAEQPEFMKELISTARIGRSLGVHLILATQKPAGQVNDQIWSNSKFKLCLKVQTQEDSNEVLKSPLAAEIREPGRAYLQVGNNEIFELLQSGFSGSPEKSDQGNQKAFDIYSLDFKGNRKLVYSQRPKKTISSRTQLEAIVDYVHDYCEASNIKKLPDICLPALSKSIEYDNNQFGCRKNLAMGVTVGIYDDPDHQVQSKAVINIGESNVMIIGSAQYGKTNLLETIIRSLVENYSPIEVNIYIIDFASMVLKNFEGLAHVGGVVCPSDDEKLKNLLKYLSDQINYRREAMLSVGVSSFSSYKEAGYREFSQIVLVIDNFTVLKDLYLQDNDAVLNLCREGISVGISIIIANAQTSGLGYKYMANFSTRISLFCNESSEYASVFGACRMRPDENPGRCLIEVDKTIYECQTFLAFEGKREIERIKNMQQFVCKMNALYTGEKARLIPEIPDILGEQFVLSNFRCNAKENNIILGLGYDTVLPLVIDIKKKNLIAISGTDNSGKSNFILYCSNYMASLHQNIRFVIFDDYKKKLATIKEKYEDVNYETTLENTDQLFNELNIILQDQYQDLVHGDGMSDEWIVLIINNEDVVSKISGTKELLAIFKDMVGKYKPLNFLVLIGSVPNTPIVYGAMEVYKIVKEDRNLLFFDNLDNIKVLDVPLTIIRNNKKRIETGDAFYIQGNDCYKVKTPLAVR
nr:type VII secretion protein EssC [Mediterraneibacter faecis]